MPGKKNKEITKITIHLFVKQTIKIVLDDDEAAAAKQHDDESV